MSRSKFSGQDLSGQGFSRWVWGGKLLAGLLSVVGLVGLLAFPAAARDDPAYHAKLDAAYNVISATPFTYGKDEVDRYGQAAMNLSGDARLYALWRVLYAYKNDQNEGQLNAWHDRIAAQAHKDGDADLDMLARFMVQAYQNEAGGFSTMSGSDWQTYLTATDPALRNIAMLERERQLQFQRQWAEAIDVGEDLVTRLQGAGRMSDGLLVAAQQTLAYDLLRVGDYDAYADHMLTVAQLSRTDAFFLQKMDMVYDLTYFAAKDGDIALAQKLRKLYGGYVVRYDVDDLRTWDQELCATVADSAGDSRGVVDCLKNAAAVTGAANSPHDSLKLYMLVQAYARLHDVAHTKLYLAKLRAMPASVSPQNARTQAFDRMIAAYIKNGDGDSAGAFDDLGSWTVDYIHMADRDRVAAVQEMYKAYRKELDRKSAESLYLRQKVQLRNMLLGVAIFAAVLFLVICVGIVMWVRRMRRMQENLAMAREHADAANAAKTRFLAVMSHELRTPLNGVLGMAQALQKEDLTDTQAEQVDVLIDSGKTLMVLLNDVLDMSRIEAGKIELAPTTASMKDMIARVVNTYSSLIQGRPLTLRSEFSEGADRAMNFDVLRVYQCLSNLVSNALKFTEKGTIRLTVSAEPIIPDGGFMVRVEVRDTGIGMSRGQMDRLFEAYNQADASTARKYGGTGLGLNISRRLAELMGGTLLVSSEEGVGSSFVMTFRAGAAVAPEAPAEAPVMTAAAEPAVQVEPADGTHILLVDDHPVNRKVARLFLEPFGFLITEAVDGQAALDLDMSRFDLVLMDLNMPRLGGLEATKRFRASEKPGHHVPIVALTADAMPEQVEACKVAGMDAHISKPILMDKLIETVNAMLEKTAARNAA